MSRSRRNQRGNAIIEATLTLSLSLWLTLGLFDFAWVMYMEQSLTHGARMAARYGAVYAYKSDDELFPQVRNITLCGNASSCSGYLGLKPDQIAVACQGSDTPPSGHSCQLTSPDARISVTIPGISYIPLAPYGSRLSGRSIKVSMPIENASGAVSGS